MIYFIKFLFFLFFSCNINAIEIENNKILFKINNKVFTNVDLERRTEYISLTNNLNTLEFSESEYEEILDDYISSLIFYEYYIEKELVYKKIKDEVELIYKKNIKNKEKFNKEEIKYIKFNINIDLIRKKLIEEKLNFKKKILLQEVNTLDLLYNYNLNYLIIKEESIKNFKIENLKNRNDFNNFKKLLIDNKIDFFYKEEDINNNSIISNQIRQIINKNLKIYSEVKNGYATVFSILKKLESYDGIFVKLINFTSVKPLENNELKCDKIIMTIEMDKTIYKEYEYTKLNNKIKNNLKSINDYIVFNDNDNYNYIILCDLTYDEKLLRTINFNKNVNSLVNKIQGNFLKKYKNEYRFIQIK